RGLVLHRIGNECIRAEARPAHIPSRCRLPRCAGLQSWREGRCARGWVAARTRGQRRTGRSRGKRPSVNALIRWSINHRNAVAVRTGIWLIVGAALAWQAPLDVFPEFVPPQVDIQTEAPGFAPEQVEQNVTRVIEAAVNGTTGLATMRSESVF